jgi:hypothetical protein
MSAAVEEPRYEQVDGNAGMRMYSNPTYFNSQMFDMERMRMSSSATASSAARRMRWIIIFTVLYSVTVVVGFTVAMAIVLNSTSTQLIMLEPARNCSNTSELSLELPTRTRRAMFRSGDGVPVPIHRNGNLSTLTKTTRKRKRTIVYTTASPTVSTTNSYMMDAILKIKSFLVNRKTTLSFGNSTSTPEMSLATNSVSQSKVLCNHIRFILALIENLTQQLAAESDVMNGGNCLRAGTTFDADLAFSLDFLGEDGIRALFDLLRTTDILGGL